MKRLKNLVFMIDAQVNWFILEGYNFDQMNINGN